jgi:HSP20 family molecular chaperone IbpA
MKEHQFVDVGRIMDEIFSAAEEFGSAFKENVNFGGPKGPFGPEFRKKWFNEAADFYPFYSYPPTNIYMTDDRKIVFEFALAGFKEEDITLEFKGDYMVFSAKVDPEMEVPEDVKYFKRRLKFKDVKNQRYYVPEDKFDRENVTAIFKHGLLKVVIPPKEEVSNTEGVKIEIIKEGE